jgi:hypothetical protein
MPPFLKIGQKYINPALVTAIVPGSCYVMRDGVEVEKKKVTVHFGIDTHTFYDTDAAILLKWLSDYALNASAYHTLNHAR